MHITPYEFDTSMNLIGRSNVLLSPNSTPTQTCKALYLTLNNLSLIRAQWRFKLSDTTRHNGELVATSATVTEDGEYLGSVDIVYKGREYKVQVSNDRINAKRERGRGYHTDDPAKAELRIRKTFFRLAKDERVSKAHEEATRVLEREFGSKAFEYDRTYGEMLASSKAFAEANLSSYLEQYPSRKLFKAKCEEMTVHRDTVKLIKESFDKGQGVLVVLDGTQYLTKVGKSMDTYTDDTLPYDIRMKLGMLKLVEDKQMISDVGCRVNKLTYVVTPEQVEKEQS